MFIAPPPRSEAVEHVYSTSRDAQGFVMNLTRAWAWRPEVFEAFAALRNQLTSQSKLTRRDQAVIVCATAGQLGDSYCALAWGRTLAAEAGEDVAAAVIAARDDELGARDKAIAEWVRKIVEDPSSTHPSDLKALRVAGLGDREIFEATAFAAFRIAFSTVNDALGVAPDPQVRDAAPEAVRHAVDFGRMPEAVPA